MEKSRRKFIRNVAGIGAGVAAYSIIPESIAAAGPESDLFFTISLAEWSLNKTIRRWNGKDWTDGKAENLDFPVMAKKDFGIHAVEYVNTFFYDKAGDKKYLRELKKRCESEGVRSLLIMVDQEGRLGDPHKGERMKSVANHYKWVEAAKLLGCHSIRVNAASQGSWGEQVKLAADGLRRLCEFGDAYDINIIVENHGGLSSNGQWLSLVMEMVDHMRCGTLPDFGNFKISSEETYDRYKGIKELMPWAKGVSAKSYDFEADGNHPSIDYYRMLKIVKDAGYRGYIGIEYEGKRLGEAEGILATKALLEKAGAAV
jgi:sugar phosphate isomerase/epimerase